MWLDAHRDNFSGFENIFKKVLYFLDVVYHELEYWLSITLCRQVAFFAGWDRVQVWAEWFYS